MSATGKTQTARQQLQAFLNAGLIDQTEYEQALAALDGRVAPPRGHDPPSKDTKKPRHLMGRGL